MKLIMTKGLPGSGKTTWAKEFQRKNKDWSLICKDDLRKMLHQGVWSNGREKQILQVRDEIIKIMLKNKINVIVHDTNLAPKHEERLRQLAKENNASFEIKDFTDIPLEQCIKQDLLRFDSVGEKVIRDMWNQWLKPKPVKPEVNLELATAILCDVDGTLALFGDANPYDRDFSKDEVNEPVADILEAYRDAKKVSIILVSGRNNKYYQETVNWLTTKGIPFDALFMPRNPDDKRKDFVIKKEVYENHIKGKVNVLFVLDDRNQVVDLWRSLGLTCLQVAEGDF